MGSVPRLNIHLRIQHGVLLAAVTAGVVTGKGIGLGLTPPGVRFDLWYDIHRWAGITAALTVLYHVLYLFVRGYVEGRHLPTFPLAWREADWQIARGEILHIFGTLERRPESGTFPPSRKALYWSTGLFLVALALTGGSVSYWEHLAGAPPLSWLPYLAQTHRGLSLLLLAVLLWHLYGVLFSRGRLAPEWSWLTGTVPEELAREKLPGLYREFQRLEEERLREGSRRSSEEEEAEEQKVERRGVETELEEGNRLAKEEKFVEALYHYRKALERFPAYSQARYNMALVLRKMGERSMAVENFKLFLQNDPFHPLARKAQELIEEMEGEE